MNYTTLKEGASWSESTIWFISTQAWISAVPAVLFLQNANLFILFAAICFIPFLMVISASLTESKDLTINGFSILLRKVDISAYQYLFANPKMIIDGYKVTFFITIVGTALGLLVMTLVAYPLSRPRFKLKKFISYLIKFKRKSALKIMKRVIKKENINY